MSNSSFVVELSLVRSRLAGYYLPPIFFFGIIGNILNLIIFSRNRLRQNVVSWYFICLSISQILFLFYNCLYRIITTGWNNGYDLAATVVGLCKFRAYGFILWLALSRHFLCLISLDRWMKTSRNVTIREKSSPQYAKWLILMSFIFWCLFSVHGPIGYNIISTNGCTSMVGGSYQLLYTIHTIFIGIVPFSFMISFGFLTLKNIRGRNQINPISTNNSNVQQRQRSQTDFQLIRLRGAPPLRNVLPLEWSVGAEVFRDECS